MIAMVLGFLLGFIGSIPLAGPIAVMVLHLGLKRQYIQARLLALGGCVAEGVYCLLAALGMETVLSSYPRVAFAAELIGAGLFIAMGVVFLLTQPGAEGEKPEDAVDVDNTSPFVLGLMVAGLNPMLLLTWSAVATALRNLIGPFEPWEIGLFTVAVATGIYMWFVVMIGFMQRHGQRISPVNMAIGVRICGVAMTALGLWSLYSTWR